MKENDIYCANARARLLTFTARHVQASQRTHPQVTARCYHAILKGRLHLQRHITPFMDVSSIPIGAVAQSPDRKVETGRIVSP
jgi:hypothetical protein